MTKTPKTKPPLGDQTFPLNDAQLAVDIAAVRADGEAISNEVKSLKHRKEVGRIP